jgi:hypothetical protein
MICTQFRDRSARARLRFGTGRCLPVGRRRRGAESKLRHWRAIAPGIWVVRGFRRDAENSPRDAGAPFLFARIHPIAQKLMLPISRKNWISKTFQNPPKLSKLRGCIWGERAEFNWLVPAYPSPCSLAHSVDLLSVTLDNLAADSFNERRGAKLLSRAKRA